MGKTSVLQLFDIKTNYNCNCNCVHCFIAERKDTDELSFDKIKTLVDEQPIGSIIVVTGGEPTIGKYFFETIKYIHGSGRKAAVQTNGMRFSDYNFAKKCSPYLEHVMFNFHSHDPDTFRKITNYEEDEDSWENANNGLTNLYNLGVSIATQTVITKYNLDNLINTYEYIQNKWPDIIMYLTMPHPIGNLHIDAQPVVRYEDAHEVIQESLRRWNRNIVPVYIPKCYLYPYNNSTQYINVSDFSYEDDFFLHWGYDPSVSGGVDVSEDSTINYIKTVANSSKKVEACNGCVFFNSCYGVRSEYIDIFGKFEAKPVYEIKEQFYEKKDGIIYNSSELEKFKNCDEVKIISNDVEDVLFILDNLNINKIGLMYSKHFSKKDLNNFKNLNLNYYIIPIQSSVREINDKISPVSLDDAISIMEYCSYMEIGINVLTNINKLNKDDLSNIFHMYKNISGSLANEFIISSNPYVDESIRLPYNDIKKYLYPQLSGIFSLRAKDVIRVYDIPFCAFGEYQYFIKNKNEKTNFGKIYHDGCDRCVVRYLCDGIYKEEYEKIRENGYLYPIDPIYEKDRVDIPSNFEIQKLIGESYKTLREDPSKVYEIYDDINSLTYKIMDHEVDDLELYNRLMSLIALKNDAMLQENLSKKQIDLYLEEVKFCISKKAYLINTEAFDKITEAIAKIQHAYNLIGSNIYLRDYYSDVVNMLQDENVINNRIKFLEKHIDYSDNYYAYHGTTMTYMNYIIFHRALGIDYTSVEYNPILNDLMNHWKYNKILHYNMSKEDIENEGYNKYDFIWK